MSSVFVINRNCDQVCLSEANSVHPTNLDVAQGDSNRGLKMTDARSNIAFGHVIDGETQCGRWLSCKLTERQECRTPGLLHFQKLPHYKKIYLVVAFHTRWRATHHKNSTICFQAIKMSVCSFLMVIQV